MNLIMSGCGIKIGEKAKDTEVSAKVKSSQCLNQSISDFQLFLLGDATDEAVEQSLFCLQNVFVAFKDNIRGQNKDSFTPQEIVNFVEANFFADGTKISPQFLAQVMKFKVVLFGGSEVLIQKQEIDQVASFMARLKPDLIRLNPHMKIIAMQWKIEGDSATSQNNEERFQSAKDEFRHFTLKFLGEFESGGRAYQIDHLIELITETAKFVNSSEKTITTIQKSRVFLKKFKQHLIGGTSSIRGDDWKKLGLTLSEAYFQALRYKYFLDPLHNEQVEEKWSFYRKIALDLSLLVETLLKAKETQSLTNDEIYDLLQPLSEIIPQIEVNLELLKGLGDLKIMLLGKSALGNRGWSHSDFIALDKKIPDLFKNLSIIFKQFDGLSLKNQGLITYPEFTTNETKLLLAIYEVGHLLEGAYDIQSLKSLIKNLALTLLKGNATIPKDLDAIFNVALSGKTLLTGQKSSILTPDNLKVLFNVGIRAYLNYAEYSLFLAQYEMKDVRYSKNLIRLWPKVKDTLLTELKQKYTHFLSTEELTDLVLTLQKEKYLSAKFRESSLTSLFNALWSNILNNPESRIKDQIAQIGFNQITLDQLSKEVFFFLKNQKNISEIFENTDRIEQKDLLAELNLRLGKASDAAEIMGLTQLKQFVNQAVPLTFNDQGFLKILSPDSNFYRYTDLAKSNIALAISRLVIQGYAEDLDRATAFGGLLLPESEFVYAQLKPAAVDFEIIEESNTTFISSRFREANLFLATSNGDSLADLGELHQLILHILSGVERANVVKQKINANCPPLFLAPNQRVLGVGEDCVLNIYQQETDAFLDMPIFLDMRTKFKPDEMKAYYLSLLKAAGHVPNDQQIIYFTDANLFPHVVQYIEMIFATHDLNKDGFLQKNEAMHAFPVFKSLLKQLVASYKQIKEEDLPGVFIYILKFGRPPNPKNLGELLKFVAFIRDKDQKGWDIQSTRVDLGKIFNYIADATKPVVTPAPLVTN